MKILVLLAIASICFASCNSSDSTIIGRGISDQGHWVEAPGDSTAPQEVFDSVYTVAPSFHDKVELAKVGGGLTWCYVLGILGFVLVLAGGYFGYNQKTAGSYAFILFFLGAILCFGGAAACVDWAHEKQGQIPKTEYDSLMKADGNLNAYWDQNLLK